jgi:hypothetical protein
MPILAEQMAADALEAMKLSRKFFVVELDFSAGSVASLDEMIGQWQYALPGGNKPENVEKLVRVWGAYLGETIRRTLGGEWTSASDEQGEHVGLLGRPGRKIQPHAATRTGLTGGSTVSLAEYYAALQGIFP